MTLSYDECPHILTHVEHFVVGRHADVVFVTNSRGEIEHWFADGMTVTFA